jgi:hypothetical protein
MCPFYLILFHITPFALVSTPGFGLVPSGCHAWVRQGPRPVNVTFALLIFILVFFLEALQRFSLKSD